jgi:hypothetical protein
MLTLRCTQKLLKRFRLPAGPAVDPPPSTTILGDWYANVVAVSPSHVVICVSERSRLCVVVPAIRLATHFPAQFRSSVRHLLHDIGIPEDVIERELKEMEEPMFAVTSCTLMSRSMLGTLNDFAKLLQADMRRYQTTLSERGRIISCTPCGPLNMHAPDEVARDLLLIGRISRPPVVEQISMDMGG